MHRLVALDLPGGPGFVDALLNIWAGGDAAFPIDQRLPHDAKRRQLRRFGVGAVIDTFGEPTRLEHGSPVEDGDALVVATSGSTGEPRGVVLTHRAVAASAEATSRRLGVSRDDHWLACLPLSHVGGLSVVTRALHLGTGLTVLPGFAPDAVQASGSNLVSLVATALRRIDPSVFRTIVLGGSHPPADRPANTVTTYGMTETGSGVVYDGRPLDGVEIRIVDDEVQLRCPMIMRCYRDGTDPRTSDGWYPTGDIGELDSSGLLVVQGRRDELIISGGENIWPEPVEAILRNVPGVSDVEIVGEPDPEWGQIVTARVVLSNPAVSVRLEQLREAVKAELPGFCAPREVSIVPALPHTTLGKLKRKQSTD